MVQVRRIRSNEGGFTLVELMVSLTVLSVAIAAAFALAFSLMNGFRDHRGAVNVENTTRIVLDILASGVRAASPGMINGEVWDPCTGGLQPTIEVLNDADPLFPGPDELRVIHALGGALASLDTVGQDISTGSVIVDSNESFESEVWVPAIIVDATSKAHLVEVFASATDSTAMDIRAPGDCPTPDWNSTVTSTYDPGSFIVRAVYLYYTVQPPLLLVDPDGPGALNAEIMAEGIEDLQIAVGVENNIDPGSLTETIVKTDDEWFGNDVGDAIVPVVTGGAWRALRISVVGVDARENRETGGNFRPTVEDHAGSSVADPFRRRVFSTTVSLRNFESRQ